MKFYPFRVGSIGAYGPVAERIKVHGFFAKTVGTVPVFVGSVPFLLCRVNAPLVYFFRATFKKYGQNVLHLMTRFMNYSGCSKMYGVELKFE